MTSSNSLIRNILAAIFLAALPACGNGSSADIEYVALGASDVVGIGATPLTNGYPYLIEDDLERKGHDTELENQGIPGAEISTINNLERPLSERDNPDLITLTTGVNDLVDGDDPATFEEDLGILLGGLRNDTDARVFVGNIPDLTKLPKFIEEPDKDVTPARIAAYNDAIARQAAATGAHLVDLFAIEVGPDLVVDGDGFHPNDKGHQTIAAAFLAVIHPFFPPNSGQNS